MPPTKVGAAPVSAGTTPVEEPSRTSENHQTHAYYTRTQPERNTRVSSNFFRGLRFALAFDLFLIAFVVAAAYLVGYIAVHVPTAVVILGGLVLVGLVVVRGVR